MDIIGYIFGGKNQNLGWSFLKISKPPGLLFEGIQYIQNAHFLPNYYLESSRPGWNFSV